MALTHPFDSDFINPLPRHFALEGAGIGGRLKAQPEDFLVDELPLYSPSGEGEHLYLGVQKTNVSHSDMIRAISRMFHVKPQAVGFAGMKDRRAVTRQQVSVHLPGQADPTSLETGNENLQILWAMRHRNKLRRGHLEGNRFSIHVRDVDPVRVPFVLKTLRHFEAHGVPTYFGSQRFGYRLNNHLLGARLLLKDWQGVLDELLGAHGSPFPEHQQERRELYDAGDYDSASKQWSRADRSEWAATSALAKGASPEKAVRRIGATTTSFWVCALQSAIFNRTLDQRIERGALARLFPGDLAWKHDNRSVFAVTAGELTGDVLNKRLAGLEISPSGPLWGASMTCAQGMVADDERAALNLAGDAATPLEAQTRFAEGQRRPMRAILRNPAVEAGVDERGGYIKVAFDLPRGIYATIVLREIMRTGASQGDVVCSTGDPASPQTTG